MPISQQDAVWIEAELTKKGVSVARGCPECGQTKWTLVTDFYAPIQFVMGVGGTGHSFNASTGLPLICLTCDNCGFLRGFTIKQIGYQPGIGGQI